MYCLALPINSSVLAFCRCPPQKKFLAPPLVLCSRELLPRKCYFTVYLMFYWEKGLFQVDPESLHLARRPPRGFTFYFTERAMTYNIHHR
jgi:hypothetical protein